MKIREFTLHYHDTTKDGVERFIVSDHAEEIWTDLVTDRHIADKILNLVNQAYRAGMTDMREHVSKSLVKAMTEIS